MKNLVNSNDASGPYPPLDAMLCTNLKYSGDSRPPDFHKTTPRALHYIACLNTPITYPFKI